MAVPRNSLRSFLVLAKETLRNAIDQSQKITFVIGNESAGTPYPPTISAAAD